MFRKISTLGIGILMVVAMVSMLHAPPAFGDDSYTPIHTFEGGDDDGDAPTGSLLYEAGILYGTTSGGGSGGFGTIFSIDTYNGFSYNLLHSFTGINGDGKSPQGDLTLDRVSGKLYGTTCFGGAYNGGSIFSIDTDGSDFSTITSFYGGIDNGAYPTGSLLLSGGLLYGTTTEGGEADKGTVFAANKNGGHVKIIHNFTGGPDDGDSPRGSLIMDRNTGTLYGMTSGGGQYTYSFTNGTIFSVGTTGLNFNILHDFSGWYEGDGGYPNGSLLLDSGMLYGMTCDGGPGGAGTIFSMDIYGNSFNVLHEFSWNSDNGANPYGSLVLTSGKLYGMTKSGGALGYGTIFSIDTDGSNFLIMQDLGGSPYGSLFNGPDKFYGMTYGNAANNPIEYGNAFYINAPLGSGGNGGVDDFPTAQAPEPATIFTILGGLAMAGYRRVRNRFNKAFGVKP
jgi:uncharacterized repeat protein (TIGR03803 family)